MEERPAAEKTVSWGVIKLALLFACYGFVAAMIVYAFLRIEEPTLAVSGTCSAALTGVLLWRFVFRRGTAVTVRRGALTGAVAGVLALPVMWIGLYSLAWLSASLSGQPQSPITAWSLGTVLWTGAGMGLLSALYAGWITVPVGALAGAFTAWWMSRSGRRQSPASYNV